MKVEQVRKLKTPFDVLVYWITERESIRRKRALGLPPPWTDDEILGRFRFCNVRRMDDKVSQWLLKNWYEPYKDHKNILVAITLARQVNRIEALEEIPFPEKWQPKRVLRILQNRTKKGLKNFSAAYMITGTLGGTKIEQVVNKVVGGIAKQRPKLDTDSIEDSVNMLCPYDGFSTFIAGQVVADARWAISGQWRDKDSWASIGPGSRRGMNRLKERDYNYPLKQKPFEEELLDLMTLLKSHLPTSITERIEAIDYQNCLCEFDKYVRTLTNVGRPKQLYRGGI